MNTQKPDKIISKYVYTQIDSFENCRAVFTISTQFTAHSNSVLLCLLGVAKGCWRIVNSHIDLTDETLEVTRQHFVTSSFIQLCQKGKYRQKCKTNF